MHQSLRYFSSRLMKNERLMIFEKVGQTRDFVHVRNIIQANLLALETNKAEYQSINIGTGDPFTSARFRRYSLKVWVNQPNRSLLANTGKATFAIALKILQRRVIC